MRDPKARGRAQNGRIHGELELEKLGGLFQLSQAQRRGRSLTLTLT